MNETPSYTSNANLPQAASSLKSQFELVQAELEMIHSRAKRRLLLYNKDELGELIEHVYALKKRLKRVEERYEKQNSLKADVMSTLKQCVTTNYFTMQHLLASTRHLSEPDNSATVVDYRNTLDDDFVRVLECGDEEKSRIRVPAHKWDSQSSPAATTDTTTMAQTQGGGGVDNNNNNDGDDLHRSMHGGLNQSISAMDTSDVLSELPLDTNSVRRFEPLPNNVIQGIPRKVRGDCSVKYVNEFYRCLWECYAEHGWDNPTPVPTGLLTRKGHSITTAHGKAALQTLRRLKVVTISKKGIALTQV